MYFLTCHVGHDCIETSGEPVRYAMPDGACIGVSVEGAQTGRKTHYDGRIVDVDNPRHQRALRELGAFPVNLGGRPDGGYHCSVCDFASFFTRCSKCDNICERGS